MLTKFNLLQIATAITMTIGALTDLGVDVQANPSPAIQSNNQTTPVRYGHSIALGAKIKTVSGNAETALAEHLVASGAVFYGAFWCSYCQTQKSLFGAIAATKLPYIECDKNGDNPQRQLCIDKNIKIFPTWVINGKYVVGTHELKEIAELTGYKGPTNFKYQRKDLN